MSESQGSLPNIDRGSDGEVAAEDELERGDGYAGGPQDGAGQSRKDGVSERWFHYKSRVFGLYGWELMAFCGWRRFDTVGTKLSTSRTEHVENQVFYTKFLSTGLVHT